MSDVSCSLAALERKASSLCKADRLEVGNGIFFSEVTNIYFLLMASLRSALTRIHLKEKLLEIY